jgi:hypothetical protein
MRFLVVLLLLIDAFIVNAQTPSPRQLAAKRTSASIKIDGNLDENVWRETIPATGFIEWRPTFGAVEDANTRTEIYLVYDNTSIYVGGYCHERTKDSVSKELVGRDVIGVNDYVGVIFDTYHDKINGFGFYVTPLGEQFDAKYSTTNGEDGSWSAVWDSESKLVNDGWTFEMRIPYSAIRFVSSTNQTWGLNITRNRKKVGRQFMWNPVDPKINGFVNQSGEWTGIEKIDAPLRLSFSPYLSAYVNHYPAKDKEVKDITTSINGGMDVKYGISNAFTLDMTLIPDFGQVRSDNLVLNVSPFEVRYQENRPFFTEGTELFNKGNLFYSRRIGGTPIHSGDIYSSIASDEHVIKNPSKSKLINATKISGRTKKGLGVGFFNAVTKAMYAEIEDSQKNKRKIQTDPLTNYNIIVFDQSLKNNSSVSFINTNVLRSGYDRDANVSAALFNFNNKKNTYNWNGKFSLSQLFHPDNIRENGYSHSLSFGKTGGNLVFNMTQQLLDDKYNIRDMGIYNNNNYLDHYLWVGYRWLKPKYWYNRMGLNYNASYSRRYKKSAFQGFNTNVNGFVQFKSLWWAGFYVGYNSEGNDFYESRNGKVYKSPSQISYNAWFESNFTKKYYANANLMVFRKKFFDGRSKEYSAFHRYRFNDRISLSQYLYYRPYKNDVGFYSTDTLALRNRNTVEQTLEFKYSFNNKSSINIIGRHYWSTVNNRDFFNLNDDGSLSAVQRPQSVRHQNYNNFYINAVYTLQFAPGSFLNIVWKNEADIFERDLRQRYLKNIDHTFGSPQNNNLSFKVIYFLDYLDFKKWRKKSKTTDQADGPNGSTGMRYRGFVKDNVHSLTQ